MYLATGRIVASVSMTNRSSQTEALHLVLLCRATLTEICSAQAGRTLAVVSRAPDESCYDRFEIKASAQQLLCLFWRQTIFLHPASSYNSSLINLKKEKGNGLLRT